MMIEVKEITLPETAVIGKEAFCTRQCNEASRMWQEAQAHFAEVSMLGLKNPDGSYKGFWGAMSDEGRSFLPWTDDFHRGLYLAGLEADRDAQAPEGWTKWILPARTYLVADVTPQTYAQVFAGVIQRVIPERKMRLSGAVCDFTEPASGQSRLYFPVEPVHC